MYNKYEIIYNDNGNIVVIDEFSGNALTVDQALNLCNINMDEYADNQDWDGYDWNELSIRFKED